MGRKGRWGGREYGAEGRLGRKAHPDTPTSTLTLKLRHFSARREASTLFFRPVSVRPKFKIRPGIWVAETKSTSDDSKHPRWRIAAMYVSKYVSKGLAAEVQARPLRK
jgi:hypothetical protein